MEKAEPFSLLHQVVLRSASPNVLDELERAIENAVNAAWSLERLEGLEGGSRSALAGCFVIRVFLRVF